MARLSPQKKQKLKQKAKVQSRRENTGANAVAQATIAGANQDYGREKKSAIGAQRVEVSQLNNMLGNIAGSGLKGKYAQQTVNELRSRKQDTISGLPYALADANVARRDAIAGARSDLLANQLAQQQDVGSRYNDLLDTARSDKQGRIEDRIKDREDNPGGLSSGVKNALIVANAYMKAANPKEQAALMADRNGFILGVAKDAEGADQIDAKKAVAIIMRRVNKPIGSAAWAREKAKRTG